MEVVVAALGPAMLRIAGELAHGTNTWMAGERTMEGHVVKRIVAAADEAGWPSPRIVGGYPILLTHKPDRPRRELRRISPSTAGCRAIGPCSIAKAPTVRWTSHWSVTSVWSGARSSALADMGVTDFNGSIMDVEAGAFDRTLAFLASLKR